MKHISDGGEFTFGAPPIPSIGLVDSRTTASVGNGGHDHGSHDRSTPEAGDHHGCDGKYAIDPNQE